jgi:hypothetical protein
MKETRFVYGFRTEFHLSVWDSANYRTVLCGLVIVAMGWDGICGNGLLSGPFVLPPADIWVNMEQILNDIDTEGPRDFGGNPTSVPLSPLQIAHKVTWARLWTLFRNRQVTIWATTRPILWTISRGHFLRREYGYAVAEAVSMRPLTIRGTGSRPCQSMYVCIAVDFLRVLRFPPVSIIPPYSCVMLGTNFVSVSHHSSETVSCRQHKQHQLGLNIVKLRKKRSAIT